MKLTKRQFCTAVDTYKDMLEQERDILNVLDVNPEWAPSKWINSFYDLLTDVCELDEDPMYGSDLDWFCFETEFGKREDYCKVVDKVTGRTWTITTPETLYDFITRED